MFVSWLSNFAANCAAQNFFDFPVWYKYLHAANRMEINRFTDRCELRGSLVATDFALIGLAFVDIALRLAALVTIGYIIWGGIQFVIAQGEADRTKKARQTIINALIGLIIALIATAMVVFIGSRLR
jgi:hypothetical protein